MVFSIFTAMKLGLIAPVVPFPSNKKLEKAKLGHFHALSSNQASKTSLNLVIRASNFSEI